MKWVLITGATSGIGLATAEYLAGHGYNVIATGRNELALKNLARRAAEKEWHLHVQVMDVCRPESISVAVDAVDELTRGYGLDVLINNAGYGQVGFIADLSEEQIRRQFDVNLFGPIVVTKAFLPLLIGKESLVINMGGMMGRVPYPWTGIYCTTKRALRTLVDVMRVEFDTLGIKVVLVEPGAVKTSFQEEAVGTLDQVDEENSYYAATHRWLREHEYRPFAEMMSKEPLAVAMKLESIIRSKRPKPYYVTPFVARLVMAINDMTPRIVMDWAMRQIFHLNASRRDVNRRVWQEKHERAEAKCVKFRR